MEMLTLLWKILFPFICYTLVVAFNKSGVLKFLIYEYFRV